MQTTPDYLVRSLNSIRRLAGVFPFLYGLRLLPIALFAVAAAANDAGLLPPTVHLLGLPVAGLACWGIHRWYGRSFGVAEPRSEACTPSRRVIVLVLTAFAGAVLIDQTLHPAISALGLFMAAFVFAATFLVYPRPQRAAYAVFGVVVVGALLLMPTLPGDAKDGMKFGAGEAAFNLFVAITFGVGAIADHLFLVRSLPCPKEAGDV